ncbi:MAG: hypothetical protein OHK0038_03150 [Flammeovirgaceae bacterium]
MKANNVIHFLLALIAFLLLGIFIQNQYLISQLSQQQSSKNSYFPIQKASHPAMPQFALVPVNEDGSINVVVKGSSNVIQVDISKISTTNELEVDIREVSNQTIGDKIPVQLK